MSVCTFLASDHPLPRIERREQEDVGLFPIAPVPLPCEMRYAAAVEGEETEQAAAQLLERIRAALRQAEAVELWRVWLMDYWEFEDRPYLHTSVCRFSDLTLGDILGVAAAEVWNKPDKANPERPSFYRLIVTR